MVANVLIAGVAVLIAAVAGFGLGIVYVRQRAAKLVAYGAMMTLKRLIEQADASGQGEALGEVLGAMGAFEIMPGLKLSTSGFTGGSGPSTKDMN